MGTQREGFQRRSKRGDYGEIEVLGTYHSSKLQEVGILPTLVLVSIFLLIFGLKCWNMLEVCLGRKMPKTRRSSPR